MLKMLLLGYFRACKSSSQSAVYVRSEGRIHSLVKFDTAYFSKNELILTYAKVLFL